MEDPAHDEATRSAMAAAAGDQVALAEFIRSHQRDVWRFVAFHVHPREADDLTQETFLRAVAALPRFQGRSTVRTWLLAIARRVTVDHLRRRGARPVTVGGDHWQDLADAGRAVPGPAAFTDLVEVRLLLDGLTAERREALLLTQILGFSYAEAAQICRCEIGTIRSRVARARADLISRRDEPGVNTPGFMLG